jgi:hypothetical protein
MVPPPDDRSFDVSQALLSAALGGLLCVTAAASQAACSSATLTHPTPGTSSSATTGPGGSSSSASTPQGTASTSDTTTVATNPDAPIPDTTCDGGVSPNPQVTSSTAGAVTQDQFTALCLAQNGFFELQPHCGGSNACRGMSYDSTTQTLIDHTCRGMNSCAGFSCLICD